MFFICVSCVNITSFSGSWKTVPEFRAKVKHYFEEVATNVVTVRKAARNSYRWMDAYEKGLDGKDAKYSATQYRAHRRIPDSHISKFLKETAPSSSLGYDVSSCRVYSTTCSYSRPMIASVRTLCNE